MHSIDTARIPRTGPRPKAARFVLAFTILLAGLAVGAARAALPPGSYDALRIKASEVLIIEVKAVTTRDVDSARTAVRAEVEVLAVERSGGGLEIGAFLVIEYAIVNPAEAGWAGPRQAPVLTKGGVYPAFLQRAKTGATFEPAAHGASFELTPEDSARIPR